MPFTLTMPKLSPTMKTGMIAKWHKKVGDFVESGDLLVEVATDKATIEHNALDEGFLRKNIGCGLLFALCLDINLFLQRTEKRFLLSLKCCHFPFRFQKVGSLLFW